MADLAPIPGALYAPGTMAYADIYPTHVAVGGVTTQERGLPAFAEETGKAMTRAVSLGSAESGLIGTPAGWLLIILVGLGAAAWWKH